jgi:hypothetical protein
MQATLAISYVFWATGEQALAANGAIACFSSSPFPAG